MNNLLKLEKIITIVSVAAMPILFFFITGWWLSIPFVAESEIFLFALTGLCVGVLADVFYLKAWIKRMENQPAAWMAMYLFYAIGLFGMFMGVPVFILVLGPVAGFLLGRRLADVHTDTRRIIRTAKQAARFTTVVLGLLCCLSAFIALSNRSTPTEIQHMLNLPFQVTSTMILYLIVIGGGLLLTLQWLATFLFCKWSAKNFILCSNAASQKTR